MSDRELIAALNRLKVETGSLACMGCGYEHNCGIHGCAVIREVSETLQRFQWIPVTERLPAEGMRVLAAAEGVFSGEAYLGCGGVWMRSYGVAWVPLVDMPVTHWMPLPYKPGVACDG